jgi:5-hydroxyisourate hydrolase-like protein (transthyretin family)
MILPTRRLFLSALALSLLLPVLADSQTTTPQKTLSTISGTVTIKGKPASGVVVGLRKADQSHPYEIPIRTTTDQDGKYRISNVALGNYSVMPSVPAYIIPDPGSAFGRRVMVGEGENIEDINFDLIRGGVITGKITDSDGRPAILQQVNLYLANSWDRRDQQEGGGTRQPIFAASTTSTDDRGIYRMFGLRAGRYKVAVGRGDDSFSNQGPIVRSSYRQVFYPDANDQAKATIIEVSEGSEATKIDITLGRPAQTFSASGRVVNGESGLPIPGLNFVLQRVSENNPSFSGMVTTNNKGEFVVDGLNSGKYSFFMLGESNNDLRAETLVFEVVDQDVSGLTLTMTKGETLSGVVVTEGDDRRVMERLAEAELRVFVNQPRMIAGGRSAVSLIGSDGSFRFGGLGPGITSFYIADKRTRMQIKGLVITRIERDGVNQGHRLEIKEGEHVSGVRIVVSYADAILRGTISVQNGTLPVGTQFQVRLSRPGDTNYAGFAMVDSRGSFVIEGLMPGVFDLNVTIVTPDKKAHRPVKQQVSVQEGVTNVVVTVDASTLNSP